MFEPTDNSLTDNGVSRELLEGYSFISSLHCRLNKPPGSILEKIKDESVVKYEEPAKTKSSYQVEEV